MDELSKELMIWYQHYGERTNGWYKRKVQSHLIGWTMLFCIIFNFNPIAIYKEMKQNTALREATIQVAEKMVADSLNSPGKKITKNGLDRSKNYNKRNFHLDIHLVIICKRAGNLPICGLD